MWHSASQIGRCATVPCDGAFAPPRPDATPPPPAVPVVVPGCWWLPVPRAAVEARSASQRRSASARVPDSASSSVVSEYQQRSTSAHSTLGATLGSSGLAPAEAPRQRVDVDDLRQVARADEAHDLLEAARDPRAPTRRRRRARRHDDPARRHEPRVVLERERRDDGEKAAVLRAQPRALGLRHVDQHGAVHPTGRRRVQRLPLLLQQGHRIRRVSRRRQSRVRRCCCRTAATE